MLKIYALLAIATFKASPCVKWITLFATMRVAYFQYTEE